MISAFQGPLLPSVNSDLKRRKKELLELFVGKLIDPQML